MHTLNEQEWEKLEQAHVLANVQHAFDASDNEAVAEDNESFIYESKDMLSPSGPTDAQTLAMMLQEQLDLINNEIRYKHSNFVSLISLYKLNCLSNSCNFFSLFIFNLCKFLLFNI